MWQIIFSVFGIWCEVYVLLLRNKWHQIQILKKKQDTCPENDHLYIRNSVNLETIYIFVSVDFAAKMIEQYGISQPTSHQCSRALAYCFWLSRRHHNIFAVFVTGATLRVVFEQVFPIVFEWQQPNPIPKLTIVSLWIGLAWWNRTIDIWLIPMTKAPTPTEQNPKKRDNTKTPLKTSITPRLLTHLGWLVGEAMTTQLVRLNRFTGSQPSHKLQKLCNQKDINFKICK